MWSDGRLEHRHFYHLSYQEYPIALAADIEYRVISSRVVRRSDISLPEGCYIEVRHLVQEVEK